MTRSPSFTSNVLFHDTATTEIYTLSLHDALPISVNDRLYAVVARLAMAVGRLVAFALGSIGAFLDRKSTRLNSSHVKISYAVFCLKKKNFGSGAAYSTNSNPSVWIVFSQASPMIN